MFQPATATTNNPWLCLRPAAQESERAPKASHLRIRTIASLEGQILRNFRLPEPPFRYIASTTVAGEIKAWTALSEEKYLLTGGVPSPFMQARLQHKEAQRPKICPNSEQLLFPAGSTTTTCLRSSRPLRRGTFEPRTMSIAQLTTPAAARWQRRKWVGSAEADG
jgi:hypothetical protein